MCLVHRSYSDALKVSAADSRWIFDQTLFFVDVSAAWS